LEFRREQAHLSAEQPPSREDARLPVAHADPCRPSHPGGAATQGPPRAVGLTSTPGFAFRSPDPTLAVLPAVSRMRSAADFTATVRQGTRARRGALVVHHLAAADFRDEIDLKPALVGFVVGRTIGGSVVRHRVVRRLRAVTAASLADLPAGSRTVVRALPDAARCTSVQLARDFDSALRRAVHVPARGHHAPKPVGTPS